MARFAGAGAALVLLTAQSQGPGSSLRLDGSGAFYYPEFAARPDAVVARTADGPVRSGTYLRYLAARSGSEMVEELVFDLALAHECERRGLARSAPLLARGMATQRLEASGRDDDDGSLRREYTMEALRELRIDALVQADREVDEAELKLLFERRYGAGGVRRRMRHVLISFDATRRRLEAAGASPDDSAVSRAARERARALRQRLSDGVAFEELLAESDDRVTRQLLRDPERSDEAGFVSGYDQQRYGAAFSRAASDLQPGEVSDPVATTRGYHLIELVSEAVTELADVEPTLRRQLRGGTATRAETSALRERLLEEFEFESVR